MRGLIIPASKETRIQKSVFEAIQTINRNLVCMLELQINALWATRSSHFVMLNAHTLRESQLRMQQALLTISHALYEGNPQPVLANTEKLNDTVTELRQLIEEHQWRQRRRNAHSWLCLAEYGDGATVGTALAFNLPRFAQIKRS